MKLKGIIKDISIEPFRPVTRICIETSEPLPVIQDLYKLIDKDSSIEVKRWSEHRTLTANAYYWQLVGKIAKALKVSNAEAHNRMLRSYGEVAIMCDRPVTVELPDTDECESKALESTMFHVMPTTGIRHYPDEDYRVYFMLKGSSEMTKAEFSRLLDGTIHDAKELGIETETPDEIERIKALWNQ